MKTLGDLMDEGIHVKRDAVRVIVTPICATRALAMNIGNRYIRKANIDYLCRVILCGEWRDDHTQGIAFSSSARLIDGQHRLMAIVRTGKPVIIRVDTGLNDVVQKHIDTGTSRALCDRTEFANDKNLNKRITELMTAWLRIKTQTAKRQTVSEIMNASTIWINEAIKVATFMLDNKGKNVCKGVFRVSVNVAIMEAMKRDPVLAQSFLESIAFPDGDCQPGRMMREWLLRSAGGGTGFAVEMLQYRYAWSALETMFAGKEVRSLKPLGREMASIGYPLKGGAE